MWSLIDTKTTVENHALTPTGYKPNPQKMSFLRSLISQDRKQFAQLNSNKDISFLGSFKGLNMKTNHTLLNLLLKTLCLGCNGLTGLLVSNHIV